MARWPWRDDHDGRHGRRTSGEAFAAAEISDGLPQVPRPVLEEGTHRLGRGLGSPPGTRTRRRWGAGRQTAGGVTPRRAAGRPLPARPDRPPAQWPAPDNRPPRDPAGRRPPPDRARPSPRSRRQRRDHRQTAYARARWPARCRPARRLPCAAPAPGSARHRSPRWPASSPRPCACAAGVPRPGRARSRGRARRTPPRSPRARPRSVRPDPR